MWQFIKTYLTRAGEALVLSGVMSTWTLFMMLMAPPIVPTIAYFVGAYNLNNTLITLILNRFNIPYDGRDRFTRGVAILLVLVCAPYIFPHYFLLFNALPFVLLTTALVTATFLTFYEAYIRFPRNNQTLGDDFSLVKMIFNPRIRLARLYQKIMPGPPRSLELSAAEKDELVDRQNRALNQLPEQALITQANIASIAAYPERERDQFVSTLNQPYIDRLTPEQLKCYRKYQELTIKFSPNIAMCVISHETLTLDTQNEFILVEKRIIGNALEPAKAVPSSCAYFFQKLGFNTNRAYQGANPKIPGPEESINAPPSWEGRATEYKCHEYTLVQDHPLSLYLCEAIEKFNVSLGLAPGAHSSVPNERDRPPTPPPAIENVGVTVPEGPSSGFIEQQRAPMSSVGSSVGTSPFVLTPPPAAEIQLDNEAVLQQQVNNLHQQVLRAFGPR